MLSFSFNPYTWDSSKERVDSDVVTLQLKNNKGELIKVSNLSEDIVIITPLKPGKNFMEKAKYFTKNDNLLFHEIVVRFGNTLLMMEINPQEPNVYLFAYMRFGQRPTSQDYDLNATISHDEKCVWMLSAHDKSEGQTVCSLNPHAPIQVLAERPGKYFLGLKNYNATVNLSHKRDKRSCLGGRRRKRSCVEVKDPPPTPPQGENVSVMPVYDSTTDQKYTLKVVLGSCVYWSEKFDKWISSGCRVSEKLYNDLQDNPFSKFNIVFDTVQILGAFLSNICNITVRL